ncbi:50S ribosomal protein L18 [Candidatus Pacearchaeota archaeon CG_4_9_14_0_2_um_filter_39_13]|nr:50S ribosomal protein L18 [Candidatus Pacearchaeota archaeon]OIO44298.1 MAG: hypothetical protein AUJ64_00370 [Candidatus Pacearchaeota archaeon CG1_02_39_14]PJC44346.1 MAG: 50S ribosomal protein L18 [Candidatus Pacearchaeota archaeon CG_4_9_14_0_2_um_filter_39_13]
MQKVGRTIRRRRKEGKTDYKARMASLKSGKPRLVVRKTNKYMIVEVVETDIAQDKVVSLVSSKDLLKFGWPKEKSGSLKNLAASYLTGFLLANKSKEKNMNLDIGMQRNVHKGRLYAVLKGAIEGGINIKCNEEVLPGDDMVFKKEEFKTIVNKVKGEISKNG